MKEEDLVGKEIKGFKFESSERLFYAPLMNKFIGKVGEITSARIGYGCVDVKFSSSTVDAWTYPLKEVLEQLKEQDKELSDQEIKELFNKIQML